MFVLAALAVVFYCFPLVANFLAAPYNGLLADKVEHVLTGHPVTAMPVVNLLVMPGGVAGATLLWARELREATDAV